MACPAGLARCTMPLCGGRAGATPPTAMSALATSSLLARAKQAVPVGSVAAKILGCTRLAAAEARYEAEVGGVCTDD